MSAPTASGEWPLIPPHTTSTSNDNNRKSETPQASHWLSAGAISLTGFGLLGATVLLVLCYLLAATAGHIGPGRALLLGATVSTGSVAGMALIAGRAVRVQEVRLHQTAAAMASTAAQLRVALEELPEQVRDRAALQGAAVLAVTDGMQRQLGEVATAVRDLGDQVERRIAAVEQRVDDVEETVEQAATAEAIMARVHGGDVRELRPRPNGSSR